MMEPVVRLMVACEDARRRKGTQNKIDILGVLTVIYASADAFPARLSFSVYLCLTNGHGQGFGKIVVAQEETDEVIFEGEPVHCDFGNDPTALFATTIPVPLCSFPDPGLYRVEFVYNDVGVEKYFLHVREKP
jgi:hypothetical protein